MSFLSSIASNVYTKFVVHHILVGLVKASGCPNRTKQTKSRSVQCVKLTKKHEGVTRMITSWANLRINKLQQQGMDQESINAIVKGDARFLTTLNHAISMQKEDEPEFDAWLFFHDDVESTDFFELQHCTRNTKHTKASFVIQSNC